MNLPGVEDLNVSDKRVLVRADLDKSEFRLNALLPTLNYLLKRNAKIILLGHQGRPGGRVDKKLSLKPIKKLSELMSQEVGFTEGFNGVSESRISVFENLRFWKGEEKNNPEFVKKLAILGDFYVNEAFGTSHRKHASIVGLPRLLPHAAGFRFIEEVRNLSRIFENPKKPVLLLISGIKEDKLGYLEPFLSFADIILIGGRLPILIGDHDPIRKNSKILVGDLTPDNQDITINTMEKFEKEISKAKTIVISGPVGKFEDESHGQGTERAFKAVVANKEAFKIAGGGDTQKAISMLRLEKGFNWISVGGGAMLEFLAKRTLPGIEALLN